MERYIGQWGVSDPGSDPAASPADSEVIVFMLNESIHIIIKILLSIIINHRIEKFSVNSDITLLD